MTIDLSRQDMLPEAGLVTIEINNSQPLMHLDRALPSELVVKDLQAITGKGCWWISRKIKVCVHFGAYLLERLVEMNDRHSKRHWAPRLGLSWAGIYGK